MSRNSDTRFSAAGRHLLRLDNGGSHIRLKRDLELQLWELLVEI